MSSSSLVRLPPGSVFARYALLPSGAWAVVSAAGAVLAPCFFDLRFSFSFVCSVSGSGGWVVLAPIPPATAQPALF